MATLIHNPNSVNQQSALDGDLAEVHEYLTAGAVQRGQALQAAVTVSPQGIPVVSVTTATAASQAVIGVAIDSAPSGRVVRVATGGIAPVQASASSVAAGAAFSPGASGRVAAVSATLNQKALGWMIEASGTVAGDLKLAYISPSLTAAS